MALAEETTTAAQEVHEGEQRGLRSTMHWVDGVIVCMSAFGFMLSTVGYSIGSLGALGAVTMWTISAVLAVTQSRIFVEPATMLADCSGGLAAFAREAWRRHANLIAPLTGFAYWIAYTSTLSAFGLIAAQLVQAQWFSSATWTLHPLGIAITFPQLLASAIIIAVWMINVAGMSPTIKFGRITGGLFAVVLGLFVILPFVTGNFNAHLLTWKIGDAGQSWGGIRIAIVYLYLMGWSTYPSEQAATFAPEYKDRVADTQRGLMVAAVAGLAVFTLVPLSLGAVLPSSVIGANPISFFVIALGKMLGSFGASLAVALVLIACLLTMNASTMNASRALYATSRRGYTVRIFGRLNRHHVPANAMTLDMVVNVFVVIVLNSVIGIVAASNMAYFVVVIAALFGVISLRRVMSEQHRPVRLRRRWLVAAAVLGCINIGLLVIGSTSFSESGYGGWNDFFVGLGALLMGLVLYLWRVFAQDKKRLVWRDRRPYLGDAAMIAGAAEPE
jgi:amino acid transporter